MAGGLPPRVREGVWERNDVCGRRGAINASRETKEFPRGGINSGIFWSPRANLWKAVSGRDEQRSFPFLLDRGEYHDLERSG